MFADRADAGRRLADALEERDIAGDVVLAVPRGGLPVGRVVADRLDTPLDIVAARKIGAPWNPELAIGAVASDGTVWLNDALVRDLGVDDDYIEEQTRIERENARAKVDRYRGDRPPLDLHGKTVVIVDDGVATGATTLACIAAARNAGAARVILAVPVAPPETVSRLETAADSVVTVETPRGFGAVSQHYRNFPQVSDSEAKTYLDYTESSGS